MRNLLCILGNLFLIAIFGRIILSWFPVSSEGIGGKISAFLFSVTEPVLGPLRRALPPVQMGAMALDLSPIIVLVGLRILLRIIGC